MNEIKAVPAARDDKHEIFKTANSQASFIVEAMLDFLGTDDKLYDKICLLIIKRDQDNKAEITLQYYLDVAPAKVLFDDLSIGALHEDYSSQIKGGEPNGIGTERSEAS